MRNYVQLSKQGPCKVLNLVAAGAVEPEAEAEAAEAAEAESEMRKGGLTDARSEWYCAAATHLVPLLPPPLPLLQLLPLLARTVTLWKCKL